MRVTLFFLALRGPQLCFSYLILGNNQFQFFSLKKTKSYKHTNKVKNFLKVVMDNAGVILSFYYQQIS